MVKARVCEKTTLRKGIWSPEEDQKLIAYIKRYGIWNWTQMPKPAGLLRSGKSCRLRWMNYLRPDLKLGNFSLEEEKIIIKLHEELGNRWSTIAARLPGRTDNEIKNYWHTRLKKRLTNNQMLTTSLRETQTATTEDNQKNPSEVDFLFLPNTLKESNMDGYKEATLSSSELSTKKFSSSISDPNGEIYENTTKSENIASSVTYGQLQISLEEPFPMEGLDIVEGYGATDPGFIVLTSQGGISDEEFQTLLEQPLTMEGLDMVEGYGATDPGFMGSNSQGKFSDEQLQSSLEQPFPLEGLDMVEDHSATDPGFMVSNSHEWALQDDNYTYASYYDVGNDFWPYFLMEPNDDGIL